MEQKSVSDLLIDVRRTQPNQANKILLRACNQEYNRTNSALQSELSNSLGGNCVYLPHFLSEENDFRHFNALESELQQHAEKATGGGAEDMIQWSKHMKHENPEFSRTFQRVIETLSAYFDVEVYASRLNYYPNGTNYKPMHRDSHAYGKEGGKKLKEDFTMGCSFGAERSLAFLHEQSQVKFTFPQKNGDLFAFSSEINDRFLHGVPKTSDVVGKRFSIIAWGRRRSLTERNSTAPADNRKFQREGCALDIQDVMEKVRDARLNDNKQANPRRPSENAQKSAKHLIFGGRLQ